MGIPFSYSQIINILNQNKMKLPIKKSTFSAILAGCFLGSELANLNVGISSFTYWVILVLGALVLNWLYQICR